MDKIAEDIRRLHEDGQKLLLDWLERPPKDRRQKQAFELLSEAVQLLRASSINLGFDEVDEE
jgi:hypothetical protein